MHVCFLFARMFIALNLKGNFVFPPRERCLWSRQGRAIGVVVTTFVATEGMSVEDHGTRTRQVS